MPISQTRFSPTVLQVLDAANLSLMRFSDSSRVQVKNMARKAGVRISDEIVRTYCLLREFAFSCEDMEGACPSRISDQELFAEILTLFDKEKACRKFKKAYPNIFDAE